MPLFSFQNRTLCSGCTAVCRAFQFHSFSRFSEANCIFCRSLLLIPLECAPCFLSKLFSQSLCNARFSRGVFQIPALQARRACKFFPKRFFQKTFCSAASAIIAFFSFYYCALLGLGGS